MFQSHQYRKKSERHGHSNDFIGKRANISNSMIVDRVIEQAVIDTNPTTTDESFTETKTPFYYQNKERSLSMLGPGKSTTNQSTVTKQSAIIC